MSFTLSYHQTRLVKATIPALREQGETITAIFYRNMLAAHPELSNMFNAVNQANHRQPRALTSVILAFASALNRDMSELIPKLERMCNKHCSLGISPDHYDIVGTYLLAAFGQVLGSSRWTAETRVAWTKAYWILARMLIGREKQLYAAFGAWTGWRPFRVDRKEAETDDMVSFYLVPQDPSQPLPSFLPGQYVSVQAHLPALGCLQSRQFSLSDAPHEDYYRILVKKDLGTRRLPSEGRDEPSAASGGSSNDYHPPGQMTNFLIDQLQPGDVVDVTHPAGEFFLDTNNESSVPVVLVSAGVGVAPMVSMLNTVLARQPGRAVSWVHGARRTVPFGDHLRAAQQQMPHLRTTIFKTRFADGDLTGVTHDYDARVDLAKVAREDLFLHHGGTEYYICGPEQFMVEMADYLKLQGVDLHRLKFELFSTGDMAAVGK